MDLFGDALPDIVQTTSAGAYYFWQNLGDANIDRRHPQHDPIPTVSPAQPNVAFGDMGGDGVVDLVVDAPPLSGFFESTPTGHWKPFKKFDYFHTALDSFDYRQQVIQELGDRFSADRPFSFRHEFADQWYHLHNPGQTKEPMTVRFETRRADFPPNLEDPKIEHVVLYFARKSGTTEEIEISHLHYKEKGVGGILGGGATSIDGVVSTRRGNAGSWITMTGKSPVGEWELALSDTPEIRNRFENEEIEDILFVITYKGRTPEWPA